MSELQTTDTGEQTIPGEVHSDPAGYDGSRTPPDVQYEIMRRHKAGASLTAICRDVHCDPRTAKAVIQNWGNELHRLKLEAHKAQLIDNVILSWEESAKRGKSDSLRGWTDSLGITEPVKGAGGSQVAVQINLNGGAEPLSLAKVQVQSESLENQAGKSEGLISHVMNTAAIPPQVLSTQALSADPNTEGLHAQVDSLASMDKLYADATFVADGEKQA
jgi:hypothetical protein